MTWLKRMNCKYFFTLERKNCKDSAKLENMATIIDVNSFPRCLLQSGMHLHQLDVPAVPTSRSLLVRKECILRGLSH